MDLPDSGPKVGHAIREDHEVQAEDDCSQSRELLE
jgi:hypothetical protein